MLSAVAMASGATPRATPSNKAILIFFVRIPRAEVWRSKQIQARLLCKLYACRIHVTCSKIDHLMSPKPRVESGALRAYWVAVEGIWWMRIAPGPLDALDCGSRLMGVPDDSCSRSAMFIRDFDLRPAVSVWLLLHLPRWYEAVFLRSWSVVMNVCGLPRQLWASGWVARLGDFAWRSSETSGSGGRIFVAGLQRRVGSASRRGWRICCS